MQLSVFAPPGDGPFPVVYFLSGLTCTPENFTTKAGAAGLGVLGGVVAVRALGPNLTFEAFSDGATSAGVVIDRSALLIVALGIGVALALAVGLAARTIRRLDHAMMLREGNR